MAYSTEVVHVEPAVESKHQDLGTFSPKESVYWSPRAEDPDKFIWSSGGSKAKLYSRLTQLEFELTNMKCQLNDKDYQIAGYRSRIHDMEEREKDYLDRLAHMENLLAEVHFLREENNRLKCQHDDCEQLRKAYAALKAEHEQCEKPEPKSRPMLGLEIKMLDDAAGNKDCIVVVHDVTKGGPAAKSGIRPGDILKEWEGVQLESKARFQRFVDNSAVGSRPVLTVVRGKKMIDIPVEVASVSINKRRSVRRISSCTKLTDYFVGDTVRHSRQNSMVSNISDKFSHHGSFSGSPRGSFTAPRGSLASRSSSFSKSPRASPNNSFARSPRSSPTRSNNHTGSLIKPESFSAIQYASFKKR